MIILIGVLGDLDQQGLIKPIIGLGPLVQENTVNHARKRNRLVAW